RSDRMDDVLRGQAIAACQPRLTGRAAADRAAFLQEFGAGGAVDRAIDAAAAEQRGIGRVDDDVDGKPRDVSALHRDAIGKRLTGHRPQLPISWLKSLPNRRSSISTPSPSSTTTRLG